MGIRAVMRWRRAQPAPVAPVPDVRRTAVAVMLAGLNDDEPA